LTKNLPLSGTNNFIYFGGQNDLWGDYVISPSTVNSTSFGVQLTGLAGNTSYSLDYVSITVYYTVPGAIGARSLQVAYTAQYGAAKGAYIPASPGQIWTVAGYITGDGTCAPEIQLMFLSSTFTYLGGVQAAAPSGIQSWFYTTATNTAPAGTTYVQMNLQNNAVNGAGVCYFDNVVASQQARTFTYDGFGRVTQTVTPESGTSTTVYDTDSGNVCPSSAGDMVKTLDNAGNATCFQYDSLHRVTTISYPSGTDASSSTKTFASAWTMSTG